MIPSNERQPDTAAAPPVPPRSRRRLAVVGTAVVLLAALGALSVYYYVTRLRFVEDQALRQELEQATVIEDDAEPTHDWPQWRGPHRDGVSREKGLLTSWPDGGPPQLWKAEVGAGYSALVVADGRAITLIQDGNNEAVVCWDADTGHELWRFRYPASYTDSMGDGPRSTPAIADGRVYSVGATGMFHCLDAATGKKLWDHDLLAEFQAKNLQWGVSFSPLVEGDLVLTNPGGPGGRSLAAFDRRSGELVWKSQDDPAGYSSPTAVTAAGRRQVLFLTGAALVSVAPEDGGLLWRYPWATRYQVNAATPIHFQAQSGGKPHDYVFIATNYGKGCALLKIVAESRGGIQAVRVYESNRMQNHFSSTVRLGRHFFGFDDSHLECMDALTGKVLWKQGGFGKGSVLAADGHLIILGDQGKLALAEASGEEYREKASFSFSHGKCWTVPVLASGKLYVRDEKQVVCYDVRQH